MGDRPLMGGLSMTESDGAGVRIAQLQRDRGRDRALLHRALIIGQPRSERQPLHRSPIWPHPAKYSGMWRPPPYRCIDRSRAY